MSKKKKVKWSDKTEDETVYEMIRDLMKSQKHISYESIRDTAYEVVKEVKALGFKFKKP